MTYAKIENGAIAKTGPRPRWYSSADGAPLSDDELRDHDWLPVVYSTPEHDPLLQRVSPSPQSEWAIETKRVVAAYTVQDIPIGQVRESKLQEATDMRWSVMTGGMTLPGGIQVGTDIDDQNRITSVVANASLAGLTDADSVDFKATSGWVSITIAEVKGIAGAIGQFVQACYTAERIHHEAIEALETREAIAAYDTGQGWPVQTEQEPA